MSLNAVHGEVYSIKFLSDSVFPTNKTDHLDITEILLNVALHIITLLLQMNLKNVGNIY